MRNRLVLVVGPSGVGKDSVLDAVRQRLRGRTDIVFPRRVVTRAPGLGGEDYRAVTEAEFAAMADDGAFALHWAAHGLLYGIPISINDDLRAGRQVVINVSRGIIDEARQRYPGLMVIGITAGTDVLRQRLQARGRESAADIEERLARAASFDLAGEDVTILRNDGALEDTAQAFVALLDSQRR